MEGVLHVKIVLNMKGTLAIIFSRLYKHSSLKLVIYRYYFNAQNYIPFHQSCSLIISLDHLHKLLQQLLPFKRMEKS